MIRIGFDSKRKIETVREYLEANPEITNVVCFRPDDGEPLDLSGMGVEVEHRTWYDSIQYEYFYPLLEHINNHYLLVFDEMMRVKKRNDLTYNCCHHYGNQTKHVLVFNHLPIIDDVEDFMILVDFAFPNRFKGVSFDMTFLDGVEVVPVLPEIDEIRIDSEDKRAKYEEKRDALFDGLGTKDPDTVPRELHVWCGTNCKKKSIGTEGNYLARNGRFKKPNVFTYKDFPQAEEFEIVDFPIRRLTFNDFLDRSGAKRVRFLNSGLSVDEYYYGELKRWEETIRGTFYETASISA